MRLIQYREKLAMTQKQVCEKLGLKQNTLSQYENSRREPNLATLKKLAELYGCKIDDLVD